MNKALTGLFDRGGRMAEEIRRFDWSNSPLGPIEQWPDTLKTVVEITLASHFPKAIVWGPALTTLYNDAFMTILGNKPAALGRPLNHIWEEAWDELCPMVDAAFHGRATFIEDFALLIQRGGAPERAYFTFCYSPIRDQQGKVLGMLDTVTETTASVLATKRLAFLDTL